LQENGGEDASGASGDGASEILSDIQETLSLARRQGVLPPVRIARILAGEGTGQFSSADAASSSSRQRTIPLSVALDYVGAILDESRKEILRLKVRCSCFGFKNAHC
jgi:vacuolar protein sorting-associated protein 11